MFIHVHTCSYTHTRAHSHPWAVYGRVSRRRMLVLVDSCQGCFAFSVWTLCQTSLLSAAAKSCGGARHCPRGLIWVRRHETGPKQRWQIQTPPLLGSCRPLKTPWRDVPRSTNITKESIFSVMWRALRPQGPLAWASVRYWFGFFAFYLYCLIMWLLWVRYHFREKHRLPTRAISTSPHGGNGAFFVGLYRLWLPAWKRLTQSQNEFNRNHNLKQKSLIYHQLLILNIDLFPSHPAASQVLVKPSACLLCMTSKPL